MQLHLGNTLERRLTYHKSFGFKLWLVLLVVTGMMALTQAASADLLVTFDQSAYGGDVWIQIMSSDANFNAWMANDPTKTPILFGTNVMSAPYKVSDIMSQGGLNVHYAASAGLYVFYDDPTGNDRTLAPEPINPTIASYATRWQLFELTMTGGTGTGDQGDVSAVDCFTAPLSITSYDAEENRLQGVGWSANACRVGVELRRFATLSNPATPTAVGVAKNANGGIYRYIAPKLFNPLNTQHKPMPWPSFIPYTQSIPAGQQTHIYNQNSFLANGTNYTFGADMQLTANPDGSLSITSKITATSTPLDPNLPASGYWDGSSVPGGNPWTISAEKQNSFNYAIYAQARAAEAININENLSPYSDFSNFCNSIPDLVKANAYGTTLDMFVGEVTGAVLFGFANSPVLYNGTPIGQMKSQDWWTMSPVKAFSEAQPGHANPPFYSAYGDAIYKYSNNGVYGAPYSDRFKQASNSPLVNSVQYNGTPVATWMIGIGAPLPEANVTPEIMLLLAE